MSKKLLIFSLIAALLLAAGMYLLTRDAPTWRATSTTSKLEVWCAAGLKAPVEELALSYERAYGTRLQINYGGSGTLLSNMEAARTGDVLLAADAAYATLAQKKGLAQETIALAQMRSVLAVKSGNPLQIKGWADLLQRPELKLGLCNPESAAIGATIKSIAEKHQQWPQLRDAAEVMKSTVSELALDLKAGALDAAFMWDQTAASLPELATVSCSELADTIVTVPGAVLTTSKQPRSALHFLRWIASAEHGAPVFRKHHFTAQGGDAWEEMPTLTIYAGSVNRPALEGALKIFTEREGVQVQTVYNGCGMLCSAMQALAKDPGGKVPDAYYACDVCFVPPVADLFPEAVRLSETDIIIAVAKGNPHGIHSLTDLTKPLLRVGVCDARQSALGFLTERLLDRAALLPGVSERIVTRVPTADLLVNQLRAGSLEAAIVYAANLSGVGDALDSVKIDHPAAKAVQPYAVSAKSPHRQLAGRLLELLKSRQAEFVKAGFRLLENESAVPSKAFDAPGFQKQ